MRYDRLAVQRRDERGIRELEQGIADVVRFEPRPQSRPAGRRRRDALHLRDYRSYELTLDAVEAIEHYAGADAEVHRYRQLLERDRSHQLTRPEAANLLRRVASNPSRWPEADTLAWVRQYDGPRTFVQQLRAVLDSGSSLTVKQFTTAVRIREETAGLRPVRRRRR